MRSSWRPFWDLGCEVEKWWQLFCRGRETSEFVRRLNKGKVGLVDGLVQIKRWDCVCVRFLFDRSGYRLESIWKRCSTIPLQENEVCVLLVAQRGGWGELGKCRKSCMHRRTTSKFSRQVWCRFFPRSETPGKRLLAILLVSQKFLCLSGGDLLHGTRFLRHFTFFMTLTPKKHHLSHMSHVCVALVFSARQSAVLLLLHPAWRVIKTRRQRPNAKATRQRQSTVKEWEFQEVWRPFLSFRTLELSCIWPVSFD